MRITRAMVEDAFNAWAKAHNLKGFSLSRRGNLNRIWNRNTRKAFTEWLTNRELYLMLAFANKTLGALPKPKTMDDVKPGDKVKYIEESGLYLNKGEIHTVSDIDHEAASGLGRVRIAGFAQDNVWWYKHRFIPV